MRIGKIGQNGDNPFQKADMTNKNVAQDDSASKVGAAGGALEQKEPAKIASGDEVKKPDMEAGAASANTGTIQGAAIDKSQFTKEDDIQEISQEFEDDLE